MARASLGREAGCNPVVPGSIPGSGQVGDVSASVPARARSTASTWSATLHSAMPAGHGNRHELGGLTDATFSLIPNIEAGLAARWAWEETAGEQ